MNNIENVNPTTRFSNRVDNYVKYRPSYPHEAIDFLLKELNITSDLTIADIGSGTGILTELLLKNGNKVFGVEPNDDMRSASEKVLSGYSNFISVKGSAENTHLESDSIDILFAAQAFHWFNHIEAKKEFKRILKENSPIVLIWNERKIDSSEFLIKYEELLNKYSTDYKEVNHKNTDIEIIGKFFSPDKFESKVFENYQLFDYKALKGRLLSSSYVPIDNQEILDDILKELKSIFDNTEENGTVKFDYETKVYYGNI